MWLAFQNDYSSGVWVAVGYYHPNCPDGGDWAKKGWWRLNPGRSAIVLWTTNTYSTFYAEADHGVQRLVPLGGHHQPNIRFLAATRCTGTKTAAWDESCASRSLRKAPGTMFSEPFTIIRPIHLEPLSSA